MARGPNNAATVEVLIRDEVTASVERERARIRAAAANGEIFRGLADGFAELESGIQSLAHTVQREFGTILRLTGAGGFLGAGLVAGIEKAMQAVTGMTRAAEQNHYLADQLGLTSAQLSNLTARGQALGMTAEQSRAGITSLATALRELKHRGQDAAVYKALDQAGGASGRGFGDELMAAVKGPGGYEAGIRLFAERMSGMNADAQRKLREIFNVGSLAFRDLYSPAANDLPTILDLAGPQARRLNIAMAALNINFDNLKTRLADAVLPAFDDAARTLDQFLQGPGQKLVRQFADWASTINIPWDAIAKGLVGAIETLISIFEWGKKTVGDLKPVIDKPEKWGPIVKKLANSVIPGFVQHLVTLGKALSAIGQHKDVVAKIAAAFRGGGQTTSAPPAPGSALDLGASAIPKPTGGPGGGRPAGASRPLGFMGGGNVMLAGYPGEQDDDNELTAQVKGTEQQVLRLANYVSSLALTTDPSGAGGLAGLAGQIRARTGGGAGRGGGGTDARGPGTTTPPADDGTPPDSRPPPTTGGQGTSSRFATVRLNNPGAATAPAGTRFADAARRFGSGGARGLPEGGRTPGFPTAVHGAAYNMWFLTQAKWRGWTISDIVYAWSNHHRRWDKAAMAASGLTGRERLTDEALKDPNFMSKLILGIAAGEAPGKYPITIEQLKQAHDWFMAGGVPPGATAIGPDGKYTPQTAQPTTPPTPAQPSPITWSNQDEIDAIEQERREQENLKPGGYTPIPQLGGSNPRIDLNLNVRGGGGTRVSTDSAGAMRPANVTRDKTEADPSGGLAGFSPG